MFQQTRRSGSLDRIPLCTVHGHARVHTSISISILKFPFGASWGLEFLGFFSPAASKTSLFTILGASQPRKHRSSPARRRLCARSRCCRACSAPPERSKSLLRTCSAPPVRSQSLQRACSVPPVRSRTLLRAICALELAFEIAQCFNSHATLIHFTVFLITPCMDMHGYALVYIYIYYIYIYTIVYRECPCTV